MIISLDDLRAATDEEVVRCMNEFEESGVQTKDFQSSFGAGYSYTTLANELKNRGYKKVWTKQGKAQQEGDEAEMIIVRKSSDNARLNLNMTRECKEKYERYLKDKQINYIHTTAALELYMKMRKAGKVKVVMEVGD